MRIGALVGVSLIAVAAAVSNVTARQVGLDRATMERVLDIARGPEAARAAFHAPYLHPLDQTVERIEVVTERRRLMLIAEARIAGGDALFARGTLRAEEAMRSWRGRTSVIARLRFHPQNSYVMAPPVAIGVQGPSGEVPRLDLQTTTLFALASGAATERLPVVGATAEALFDTANLGGRSHDVTVSMEGKELARLSLDFSGFP